MKRSPIVDSEPIAFIDTSPTAWPTKRPDGKRLVRDDLIILSLDGHDDEVSPIVYVMAKPDVISKNVGDAWKTVFPEEAEGWMCALLAEASQELYDKWMRDVF